MSAPGSDTQRTLFEGRFSSSSGRGTPWCRFLPGGRMLGSSTKWFTVMVLGMLIGGCDQRPVNTPQDGAGTEELRDAVPFEVRDSSRVIVAENTASEVPPLAWSIETTPTYSFGGTGAPIGDVFGIVGVVAMSEGRVAFADRRQRVIILDSDGGLLRTIGGRGQGPGEFMAISRLARSVGDTLHVYDVSNSRLSHLTVRGGHLGSIPMRSVPPATYQGTLDDGTHVAALGRGAEVEGRGVRLLRSQLELVRYDASGNFLNLIGTVAGPEALDFGRSVPLVRQLRPTSGLKNTIVVTDGREVFVATGDRFDVLVFSPLGGDPSVIGWDMELLPLTREDIEATYRGGPLEQAFTPSALAWWPDDRTRATVLGLLVDDEANMWIKTDGWNQESAVTWSVFNRHGAHIASVEMPSRFELFDVRGGSLFGVWRDGLDVEFVQAWRLIY